MGEYKKMDDYVKLSKEAFGLWMKKTVDNSTVNSIFSQVPQKNNDHFVVIYSRNIAQLRLYVDDLSEMSAAGLLKLMAEKNLYITDTRPENED